MKKTLYIDMDGVTADFNGQAKITLNATEQDALNAAQQGRWPPDKWKILIEIPHFYRNLPPLPTGKKIVELALKFQQELDYQLYFLTAIPSSNDVPDCIYDKILWTQEHYPYIPVRFGPYSKDKHKHCKPGDILIDDRKDNCQAWLQAGGTAILYENDGTNALNNLNQLYQTLRREA